MSRRWALGVVWIAAVCAAGNWPQWRGPFLNGSSHETGLPSTWTTTENVRWAADMPGPSGATPIVWGDNLFVSSPDQKTKDLLAMCLDADTGAVRWSETVGKDRRFPMNNMASPSPVTDGRIVCFTYGTGTLVAFDFRGKRLWERSVEKDYGFNALMFGYSSTPLLLDGKLYVTAIRNKDPAQYARRFFPDGASRDPVESYLLCLDFGSGKTLWKQDRPTDARGETQEAYVTPIPRQTGGATEILLFGADYLTAHDAGDGRELWRWSGYNPNKINHWRLVPTPVDSNELVYVAGPKHEPFFAIRPGGSGRLGADRVAWTCKTHTPDASTPLLYDGRLYVLHDDRRLIACLDPATGAVKWQGELGGTAVYRASLTGANGKLYGMNESGEAIVLAAGDELKILHRVDMGKGPARSSIVAANGSLYIRTADRLFCVRK